jgi:cardiolipin synthase
MGQLGQIWTFVSAAVYVAVGLIASGHVVLTKRDARAAVGWLGVIWLAPFVGTGLYLVFGVNRIERRATSLRADQPRTPTTVAPSLHDVQSVREVLGPGKAHLNPLVRLVGEITHQSLTDGNRITPLVNGDSAYPAMIEAIDRSQASVTLASYIFANDSSGAAIRDALSRAASRGVEVRVMVDGVGAQYTWPPIAGALRRAGLRVTKFLPTLVPKRLHYSNLRNHRKILVVDGREGFTGGMNICQPCVMSARCRRPIRDLHFHLEGPVVEHLQEVFAVDWAFCTDEVLEGDRWLPSIEPVGSAVARGIADGPDEDFDKLRMTLLGAIGCATTSIQVMTPYFLPDEALITSLNVAALRGVEVDIVVPELSNLALVQWASMDTMRAVLEGGCRIWLSPPPFDHTKLMLVDQVWSLLGSANWDPRSLRLNFEFNVECYDSDLASRLGQFIGRRIDTSRPLTGSDVDGRSLPVRLRDGLARLASPYL